MGLHLDILDEHRLDILPLFSGLRDEGFYLAGGTGLALLIGHRDSIDFYFFKQEPFNTEKLFEKIRSVFSDHEVIKTQDEPNSLSILIDNEIRVSFFTFPYSLINPPIESEYFPVASAEDIACMKLNAITSRGTFKDYVDLYFIMQTRTQSELMDFLRRKIPSLDPLLVQKSLIYFDDLDQEEILFKTVPVSLEEIKSKLTEEARRYNQV